MKYHALFVIFEKQLNLKFYSLQHIIGGALWVKTGSSEVQDFSNTLV